MATERQRRGALAEAEAAAYLEHLGWRVVGRNVKVGRDEIDIVATDPGPPATLVVVEVRSLRTATFGSPEERVDRAKVGRLYRALVGLGAQLQSNEGVGRLPRRVDLVIVDRRSSRPEIRHFRALEPP
ncbi:MAG: YraN family protein [Candidatus Limnocylindrales bacterium]